MLYQTENCHGGDLYGQPVTLDFSANTSPLGTPESVQEAVRQALPELHHYPDPYCRKLTQAIARHEQVPREDILCGNGAAELIYAYCRAAGPCRAAELAPTFAEYALGLQQAGGEMVRYPLREEENFDLDRGIFPFLERTQPKLLFLCNPNNPTGRLLPPALLEEILTACGQRGIRLFLDECFLELSEGGVSMADRLQENPHLTILKAFTKSYGMAGLRLGYVLSRDHQMLKKMAAAVQPWNVSSLAQAAGVAALEDTGFLERNRAVIFRERRWLAAELEALGFRVCPGAANYLLFRGQPGLQEALRPCGITIRNCGNYQGLGPGWYRIAVRLHEENRQLIAAIRSVLGKE